MDWNPVTHYQEVSVAQRYDRDRFGSLAGRVFNALEKRVVRHAFRGISRDRSVLDLPCGTGRFAEVLLEQGFTVTGADISQAMLHVAREKLARFGQRFVTRVADVHELAHREPKRYDVALCARVLMHFPLPEQIRFLTSVTALTRGTILFTQSYDSPYQRFRRGVKRLLGNQAPSTYPVNECALQQLLAGAGLREVRRIRLMPLVSEAVLVVAEPA